jgi:hypothetical protein
MRQQHDRTEPTEHSEKKGTAAFTPEARKAARSVSVTAPYSTGHDITQDLTPEGRRAHSHAANGHTASEGIGLKAAATK